MCKVHNDTLLAFLAETREGVVYRLDEEVDLYQGRFRCDRCGGSHVVAVALDLTRVTIPNEIADDEERELRVRTLLWLAINVDARPRHYLAAA